MTADVLQKESSKYFDELYNLSLRLTCSFRKADKLMIHIFKESLIFYDYHEPADIRKWLLRIALNLYGRFYLINPETDNNKIDSGFAKLSDYIDKTEVKDTFRHLTEKDILKLFSQIPSDLRIVLILKEILNMSYSEISELIDIPAGTVTIRLNRARKFLYTELFGKSGANG